MIGERLRDIRKKRKISQTELAELLGTQKPAISRYENDKAEPNDRYKVLLAQKLDISLDYLLGLTDEPMPYYRTNEMIMLMPAVNEKRMALILDFIEFIKNNERFD